MPPWASCSHLIRYLVRFVESVGQFTCPWTGRCIRNWSSVCRKNAFGILLAKQVKQTIRRVYKERKGQVTHMDDSVPCGFVLFHSNYHMFWICLGSVCHWQVLVGRTLARTNVATVCHWDLVRKTQMARASAFGSTSSVD